MKDQLHQAQEKATSFVEPVVGFGKKTVCLGLGVAGLTADKFKELLEKSQNWSGKAIERGEGVMDDTRTRVTELTKEPQAMAEENWKKVSETWEKYTGKVLRRSDEPIETEIEVVSEQVAELEKKMEKATQKPVAAAKKTTKAVKEEVVDPVVEAVAPESN